MIVITMTDCPPRLRGDLTKWLIEINTGVYVGTVTARVRDELWGRVCENLKNGQATMVFSTNGEQKMDFRVHNTPWIPVDFEGIKLIRRPLPGGVQRESLPKNFSNASRRQIARQTNNESGRKEGGSYVVLDLETTGLSPTSDRILEIGALLVADHAETKALSRLVLVDSVPPAITKLTGITKEMLEKEGIPLEDALRELTEFIGTQTVICHNMSFDRAFLNNALEQTGLPSLRNRFEDTALLARRRIHSMKSLKLEAIANELGIEEKQRHRALDDCRLTIRVYEKLNELGRKF